MSIKFPNVPIVKGVPPVFRLAANSALATLQTGDTEDALLTRDQTSDDGVAAPVWGLFDKDGNPALTFDSMKTIEPMREWRVADYPQEQGGFQHYNKVQTPENISLEITKGGSDAERQTFLDELDGICNSVDLFNIVTPDGAFTDFNPMHYDYRRSAESGVTLLTVAVHFIEIRQSARTAFTSSTAPSGADKVQDGPVRTATPTAAQDAPESEWV